MCEFESPVKITQCQFKSSVIKEVQVECLESDIKWNGEDINQNNWIHQFTHQFETDGYQPNTTISESSNLFSRYYRFVCSGYDKFSCVHDLKISGESKGMELKVEIRDELMKMGNKLMIDKMEHLRDEIMELEEFDDENKWSELKSIEVFPLSKEENLLIRQDMVSE